MNLIPQILRHSRHRNQLLYERDVITRRISVLTNGIDTLKFIQRIEDEHRLSKTLGDKR